MDKNQILNLLSVYEKIIEDHKREIAHYTFMSSLLKTYLDDKKEVLYLNEGE